MISGKVGDDTEETDGNCSQDEGFDERRRPEVDIAKLCQQAAIGCGVDPSVVEDIYPCTPLQEGLMSLTMKRPEDYVMQLVLELRDDIDEGRLRAAWEQVVRSVAILRTRIVHTEQAGLVQVVLVQKIDWIEAEELEQYCALDKATWMRLGHPLARYALVKDRRTAKRWFVWTAHHAIYDGWSLPLILQAARSIYRGGRPSSHLGFNALVKYLHGLDPQATAAYWKASLSNCQAVPFPTVPSGTELLRTTETIRHQSPPVHRACSDITVPIIIRAAWAVVASRHTKSNDVSFGVTVTGRNAPIAGIETVIGPTIATVPLRVMVEGTQTVSAYLAKQQQQAIEMMPYEHVGLQNIARLGDDAQQACHFQTLLVVQAASNDAAQDEELGQWQSRAESANFNTYPLVLQCHMTKEGPLLEASFDPQVMERWTVERILGQFSYVVHQLAGADEKTRVADIAATTPVETAEIWRESGRVPEAQETCVHELFATQAERQPDAPAVCAWDGDLTYKELDELSDRLAAHLVGLGVRPDDVVPLCFEKSMWTVVAMMAPSLPHGFPTLLLPYVHHYRCPPLQKSFAIRLLCRSQGSTTPNLPLCTTFSTKLKDKF